MCDCSGVPLESRALLRRAVPKPVRHAVWGAHRWAGDAQQRAFERRMGVTTGGHAYPDATLGTERVFYEGCQPVPVHRVLSRLHPGPSDVFVDLGSGRGQALLLAGRLPFGRVVGLEVDEGLHRDAEANLARARPRLRCPDVASVQGDALTWDVPDDLSVLFLYSPFFGDLFRTVLQRVFDAWDRHPRPLKIVYVFPWEHDWLMHSGRVRVADLAPAQFPATPWWWRSGWVVVTYDVVADGQGGPGVPAVPRRLLRPRRALERWSAPNGHVFRLSRPGQEPLLSEPYRPPA